jgi:hypothetical protein
MTLMRAVLDLGRYVMMRTYVFVGNAEWQGRQGSRAAGMGYGSYGYKVQKCTCMCTCDKWTDGADEIYIYEYLYRMTGNAESLGRMVSESE